MKEPQVFLQQLIFGLKRVDFLKLSHPIESCSLLLLQVAAILFQGLILERALALHLALD